MKKKSPADKLADVTTRPRQDVPESDTWNLKKIFRSDATWESEFTKLKKDCEVLSSYRGKLSNPGILAEFLALDSSLDRRVEKLIVYSYLKWSEDVTNSKYLEYRGRLTSFLTEQAEKTSFVRPELLAMSQSKWKEILADERLVLWKLSLQRILRYKPYTLGLKEERLLALSGEMAQTPKQVFSLLNDADLEFEPVKNEKGKLQALSQESFQVFLHSTKREVRRDAFNHLYAEYEAHGHTLASTLEGSIKKDIFYARARNHPGAMEASLFNEEIPIGVYNNLITEVHRALPVLYRYYDLRRRKMKVDELHFYDTYVPILGSIKIKHTYSEAVELVLKALKPLGTDYIKTLQKGLTSDRWVDKYENLNKLSGAYSYSAFDSLPYIMMNFKEEVLESVFTLIHESGHSMHSWYSSKNQPYEYASYEIFLAEIASTFNEELLTQYLLQTAKDTKHRAWIINRQIDAIRATIFRQTMFSEFEKKTHEESEKGVPLTLERFRSLYRELLDLYFGSAMVIDEVLSLECLRIPHFYNAFYVYKYATGMSAALALTHRVLQGGEKERTDYFELLTGGSSAPPLEILKKAGVDMEKPEPIQEAMKRFESLVDELDMLL